jgi:rod shape-determining protein MreB
MVLAKLVRRFSTDLGIDLGTTNTRVCLGGGADGVGGKIVLFEPSVVAVKNGTGDVLLGGEAIGDPAKEMIGRTPPSIVATRPLRHGVIADFDMAEAMLAYVIRKVRNGRRWFRPRLVVTVPMSITAIEKRAVFNAAERAGARKVYLLETPRAAGLGAGVPIHEARGHMIVDVGGGTTDIAILSLADVVVSSSLRVAGDAMDAAIVQHMKRNYNILIGENTAEGIKMDIGSAFARGEEERRTVKGRDLIAGLPREVTVTSEEIREALSSPVRQIIEAIHSTLEKTGPELSGDLLETGMVLCGGGVLLRGLPELIREETGLAVRVAADPITTVARGTAVFLERIDDFKYILESGDDDL